MTANVISGLYIFDKNLFLGQGKCEGNFIVDKADFALRELLIATASAEKNIELSNRNEQIKPVLIEPVPNERGGSGALASLIRELQDLLSDSSLHTMNDRLELLLKRSHSLEASFKQNLLELHKAKVESDLSYGNFKCALSKLHECKLKLNEAHQKTNNLSRRKDAGSCKAFYSQSKAQSEFYKEEVVVLGLYEIALTETKNVNDMLYKVRKGRGDFEAVRQEELDNISGMARMIELMATMSQLISKTYDQKINNEIDMLRALQKARQNELEKQSVEYQNNAEKAQEIGKVFGILGKIVGGVLVIASIVSAVFTGGASLVIAGIGIGLMVADYTYEIATGESIIQKALQPLMDKTLIPMMEFLSSVIAQALEHLGVDKNTAAVAGVVSAAILSVIVVVAVVAVVAVVGKTIASKIAEFLGKLLTNCVRKIVPEVVKEIATGISNAISKLASFISDLISKSKDEISIITRQFASIVAGVETTILSGGVSAEGYYVKISSDAMGDFSFSQGEIELIQQWMKQIIEASGGDRNVSFELLQDMLAALQQNNEAARHILRQSHV